MKRFIALTFFAGAASAFAASPYDQPYSIITVDTKPSSDIHLKPVFVNRVDGENSVERNKHVVPPGAHDVTLDLAPRGGFHEPTQQVFKMKTEACVRYNVAARVENGISQKWEPVVRSTEPIGECAAKFKVAGEVMQQPGTDPRQEEPGSVPARSAATPLLEVSHLRVEFNTRRGTLVAIDDVSFAIAPGEVLGVVGESGAGKSITGTAIIGLLEPPGRIAGGEIRLEGERIDNIKPEAMRRIRGRRIGAIFQDPLTSLNPLYTVGHQIIETIRTHLPMNEQQARARAIELLGEVGIPAPERRIDHYPHQFSGGMRQRVVIALALCANPKLIIADEPTTALDVSIQAQIITLLKRLGREHGTAVMLVTHDMGVIAETADRVAVMYAGRIVEIGPVQQVIHDPQHPYTAGLMASIPAVGDEVERLPQIEGSMPRLNAIPAGCPFNPRCPRVFDKCRVERPPLLPAHGTQAACWLHEEQVVAHA